MFHCKCRKNFKFHPDSKCFVSAEFASLRILVYGETVNESETRENEVRRKV